MDTTQLNGFLGDSNSFDIPLTWDGIAFEPDGDWTLIFTAKNRATDPDDLAVFQKATGAGITVTDSTATVTTVPDDTNTLRACNLVCDIQAQNTTTGEVRTVAYARLSLTRDVTREVTVSVPIYTTEEYVSKGETGDPGEPGQPGPAPSGTGFVKVVDGVLQTPSATIPNTDITGLGTASTADSSTTGGANKIPKFDSVGDLTIGSLNNASLGDAGNLWIAPFRYVGFKDTAGTAQAGFYLWPNHSGGHEMVCTSQRWCFYWSQGWQFGSPATVRDGRYMYIQPNAATASDTVVESPPISLESRYWNGSANVGQSTWIQVVPSSAASGTEVLNINFGGTVGSDHRITGGVTPVKFNRTGILAAGTVQGGVWNGTAIDDAYISSSATWNAKQTADTAGILANSQTITGTTTYADLTGVTISLTAGTYVVDALVTTTQANGTMGSKVQMVASGTGVVNTGWTKMTANGLTHQPEYSINYGTLSWSEGRSLTSSQPCIYSAKIVVKVTSGTATIKLQAAQVTSDAGNLTVLSGSMIRAEKIA